jgi:sugar lactone lactonase YvrE
MHSIALFNACFLSVGCGTGSGSSITSPPYNPPTGNFTGLPFTGKVMAGKAALVGASVQVYAAGSTGNSSAPTQLFSSAITTDAGGSFTVNASYTCPFSNSILYIVARGGSVSGSSSANDNATLMSTIGQCQNLTGTPVFVVNEVTTVASAYAMTQFMSAGATLGASATNSTGISNAAMTVANLINLNTGAVTGDEFPATGKAPTARLNALANLLNACIVSANFCSSLYSISGNGSRPSNTLDAVLSIAKNPAQNVAAIYTASQVSNAYSPSLMIVPSDWTLFVTYTGGGMNDPTALGIDSKGEVWVASYNGVASLFSNTGVPLLPNGITGNGLSNSSGLAVDTQDNAWITNQVFSGSVTVLSTSGAALSGSAGYMQGGLYFPIGIAFDTDGTAWIVNNGNSHLVHLNSSGGSLSGASGIAPPEVGIPFGIAVNSNHELLVTNWAYDSVTLLSSVGTVLTSTSCCNHPEWLAVDQGDNVWIANAFDNSVTQLNATGRVISSAYTGGGLNGPNGIAIDGQGNVWVSNAHGNSITELSGAQSSSPGTVLSPPTGYGVDAGLGATDQLAIDPSGNVWLVNGDANTLTQFIGMAAPAKTPLVGPVAIP